MSSIYYPFPREGLSLRLLRVAILVGAILKKSRGSGLDLQACWADGHVREMMGLKESISLNYRVHLFRTGRST